jgi:hypothetical protein
MRRYRRTILLALAFLVAAPAVANLPLDTVEDPKARETLRKIGLQIILGDSMRGMVNANSYGWEVFHKGHKGRYRELAFSMALQGLAELQLQMNREALWHWESAQILLPELHAQMMHSYSEIAKVLDSTPMRTFDTAVEWLRSEGRLAEGEGVEPARAMDRVAAVTPRRNPTALAGERVSVTFLVDPDGRVQSPKLIGEPPSDLAVFTAMQALLSWRYTPARKNGELAWSIETANFTFRRE